MVGGGRICFAYSGSDCGLGNRWALPPALLARNALVFGLDAGSQLWAGALSLSCLGIGHFHSASRLPSDFCCYSHPLQFARRFAGDDSLHDLALSGTHHVASIRLRGFFCCFPSPCDVPNSGKRTQTENFPCYFSSTTFTKYRQ